MASTAFDKLKNTWEAANRFTAAVETDVLVTCTSGHMVRWSITADDTPPTISVGQGHIIAEHDARAMKLKTGERLWLAGAGATATLEQ